MLESLILSTILWIGIDEYNKEAKLKVSCNSVELNTGKKYTERFKIVRFYMQDKNNLWRYDVPMSVSSRGTILLEPTIFWIEEIRTKETLNLKIDSDNFIFRLDGTSKKIKC